MNQDGKGKAGLTSCVLQCFDPISGAEVRSKSYQSWTLAMRDVRRVTGHGLVARVQIDFAAQPGRIFNF